MRFELHPNDAMHAAVLEQAMRLVQAARDAQREPLRLADVVDRLSVS